MLIYRDLMSMIIRFLTVTAVILATALSQAGLPARITGGPEKYPGLAPADIVNAWDLPPLALDDLDGRQRNLYDWHGKVIVLNFWASWCGPCLTEIPLLVRYQQAYGEAGLQVIGIALDEVRKSRNVVRSLHVNYPVLVADPDDNQGLLERWGDSRQVLPYSVVIGRDGDIHYKLAGVMNDESFADYVLPLLTPGPPESIQARSWDAHPSPAQRYPLILRTSSRYLLRPSCRLPAPAVSISPGIFWQGA
jgi:thiol-disulfide isomerase/thioredoxin